MSGHGTAHHQSTTDAIYFGMQSEYQECFGQRGIMDPETALLAQSAGVTLVTLMTTDAWVRAREGITQLWR